MEKDKKATSFSTDWRSVSSKRRLPYFALLLKTKGEPRRRNSSLLFDQSCSGHTAVIFSAHLVAVKCEVFTTTSTREIQLSARPVTS